MADLVKTYKPDGSTLMVDPTKVPSKTVNEFGVLPGFTPWGTRITDGRTTAQVAADSTAQASSSIVNQLTDRGYTPPATIKPSTTYKADAGGIMTEIIPQVAQPPATSLTPSMKSADVVPADWIDANGIPHWNDGIDRRVEGSYTGHDGTGQAITPGGGIIDQTTGGIVDATTGGGIVDQTTGGTVPGGTPATGGGIVNNIVNNQDALYTPTPYKDQLNDLITRITGESFDYNPDDDNALKQAQEYASRTVLEEMNARGMFRSSVSQDRLAQVMSELIPQYEQLAYNKYQDNLNNLYKLAETYSSLESQEYAIQIDQKNYELKAEETAYNEKRDEIADAWDRVTTMGRVDNAASVLLGIPVGTLSADARKAKQDLDDKMALIDYEIQQKRLELNEETGGRSSDQIIALNSLPGLITDISSRIGMDKTYEVLQGIKDTGMLPDRLWEEIDTGELDLGDNIMGLVTAINVLSEEQYNEFLDTVPTIYRDSQFTTEPLDIKTIRETIEREFITKDFLGYQTVDRAGIKNIIDQQFKFGSINDAQKNQLYLDYGLIEGVEQLPSTYSGASIKLKALSTDEEKIALLNSLQETGSFTEQELEELADEAGLDTE